MIQFHGYIASAYVIWNSPIMITGCWDRKVEQRRRSLLNNIVIDSYQSCWTGSIRLESSKWASKNHSTILWTSVRTLNQTHQLNQGHTFPLCFNKLCHLYGKLRLLRLKYSQLESSSPMALTNGVNKQSHDPNSLKLAYESNSLWLLNVATPASRYMNSGDQYYFSTLYPSLDSCM